MTISNFDDLLQAARQQTQPQRLLLVFACADLPDDCTPEQRAQFEAGAGGALVPAMCVDKSPDEIQSFAALKQESQQFQSPWQVLFAAALSGRDQAAPNSSDIEQTLDRMVESIKIGALDHMIAFDLQGDAVIFSLNGA